MHNTTRTKTSLGGQQALRLHELQNRNDHSIHQTHLRHTPMSVAARRRRTVVPAASSRTVEAILEERQHQPPQGSAAARLRNKVDDARGGVHTERSERLEPLVPPLFDHARSAVDPTPTGAARGASLSAPTATTTKRRIVAVRRRPVQQPEDSAALEPSKRDSNATRRLGKAELAWLEKQLQLTQRAAMLERECESWWRQFYGASGSASGSAASAALAVHKSWDELPAARSHDARLLQQQLHTLRDKQRNVAAKLVRMRSGETFYAELQDLLEDLETAIAVLRRTQRERFDADVAAERVLEKELSAFAAKLDDWDTDDSCVGARTAVRSAGRVRVASAGDARQRTSSTKGINNRTNSSISGSAASLDSSDVGANNSANSSDDDNGNSADATSESELLARVRRVNERILQAGGVQGGWDDREHRAFLSLLRKHSLSDAVLLAHRTFRVSSNDRHKQQQPNDDDDGDNDDYETRVARFLQQCIAVVVTRSANAVRAHLLWYIDLLALQQQKRDAIHAWRAAKDRARDTLIHQGLVQIADATFEEHDAAATTATATAGTDEQHEAARERAKKYALLSQWRETKREREQQQQQRELELMREQEARDAKRKQELLDAKQQVQLYRLQKEQDAAALGARSQPSSASPNSAPSASPVSKAELRERSRQAIALAKAKRAKLEQLEAKQRKQRALPARPPRSTTAANSPSSPADAASSPPLLLQPTKASQARVRSKRELRREDVARQRQSAHDALIPGAAAIPDVRITSFGHAPIQPRAVPAWRRTLNGA